MIRIGFIISATDNRWLGGINYISNLMHSVTALNSTQIQPILILATNVTTSLLSEFPKMEAVTTSIVNEGQPIARARKALELTIGRDILLEKFLSTHSIDVLSHSGVTGSNSPICTVAWIPDFQRQRMPEFFPTAELARSNSRFKRLCNTASTVVLSSFDAQKDLGTFYPEALHKSRVLHFASRPHDTDFRYDANIIRSQYELGSQYFYLPNQFWKHKNHQIVIRALSLLKEHYADIQVVCTGLQQDVRHPGHYQKIVELITSHGVVNQFRILGVVPYPDVRALMQGSIAVINPSLFEGWSTPVEEARSMGKRLLLSDIAVHREQAPARASFFDPSDCSALAVLMETCIQNYDPAVETESEYQAKSAAKTRFGQFGRDYEQIVLDTVK